MMPPVISSGAVKWRSIPKIKGPVDSLSVVGYGSSSSLQLHAQVSGLKEWSTGPLSHLDWGVAFTDTDLPTGSYDITEKELSVRFAGTGRVSANSGLTLHFGASLLGGNQQSVGPPVQPSIGVTSSQVGSLKLYLGSSWSHNSTSFSGSYWNSVW